MLLTTSAIKCVEEVALGAVCLQSISSLAKNCICLFLSDLISVVF